MWRIIPNTNIFLNVDICVRRFNKMRRRMRNPLMGSDIVKPRAIGERNLFKERRPEISVSTTDRIPWPNFYREQIFRISWILWWNFDREQFLQGPNISNQRPLFKNRSKRDGQKFPSQPRIGFHDRTFTGSNFYRKQIFLTRGQFWRIAQRDSQKQIGFHGLTKEKGFSWMHKLYSNWTSTKLYSDWTSTKLWNSAFQQHTGWVALSSLPSENI